MLLPGELTGRVGRQIKNPTLRNVWNTAMANSVSDGKAEYRFALAMTAVEKACGGIEETAKQSREPAWRLRWCLSRSSLAKVTGRLDLSITQIAPAYLSVPNLCDVNFSIFAVDARCGDVNSHRGAPSRGLEWAGSEAASSTDSAGRRTVHFPTTLPFSNRHHVWHQFTSYLISRGGANNMHLELVVIEPAAQGDGIAINSGVKILESRLDMTKRARKTLNYENWNVKMISPHVIYHISR